MTGTLPSIRRHVSIDFDLIVTDVQALEHIAHPPLMTFLDASEAPSSEPDSIAQPPGLGQHELRAVVAALAASALANGLQATFPAASVEHTNVVVQE